LHEILRQGEEHVGQHNQRTTREINVKESVNKINEGKQQVSVEDSAMSLSED